MCQNPVPGSIPPPAVESMGQGLPGSVALRQVPPGRAGAHLPQDAVDDGAVVAPLAAAPTARWEQRRDDPPGLLRQLPTSYHHASLVLYCFRTRVTHPVRFVRQTLIPHLSWWARGVQGRAPAGGVTMTRVRPATPTVAFIDQYCAHYRGLFHNVRHFEQFTALHLGLLAETRLKPGDVGKRKPQLAVEVIEELLALGFRFRVVLADSLYGESGPFISALHRLGLQYVVALRSNHGVWMLPGQRIRQTRWRPLCARVH